MDIKMPTQEEGHKKYHFSAWHEYPGEKDIVKKRDNQFSW